METDPLRYDEWIEEALCHVVKRALELAAGNGLPGDHHYYIGFETNHAGVVIPGYMRAEYPNDMTIVLQHQFENLIVDDAGFEVSLRFNGKLEHLQIPFAAISSFSDPSVGFGIQIKSAYERTDDGTETPALKGIKTGGDNGKYTDPPPGEKNIAKMGEVIALDSFRKK